MWRPDRHWDLRPEGVAEALGWHEVTIEQRPADTDTHTWDRAAEPVLVDDLPVIQWVEREWTEEELQQRAEQAAINADFQSRLEALEAWRVSLEAVDPETNPGDVQDWPSDSDALHAHDAILPGALVRWPAATGLVYRNGSSTPLGHSPALIPPEQFPHLWQRVETSHDPEPEPEPGEYLEWEPAIDYEVGDRRTWNGRLYECHQAHINAPPNWSPDLAWTHWTDLGPA